uniref:Mediator of RNA polymerase II transcription subunit 15 n=1 Tax=Equus caballus TaxID=9796 RepID=A0A9L0S4P0_HORSE
MDVTGQETDWRSAAFRQKLVSQIEDAMRKAGVAHSKSSKDMESHVFLKAKTRPFFWSSPGELGRLGTEAGFLMLVWSQSLHSTGQQGSLS